MGLKTKEIWFIVGSQFLYGPQVLQTVDARGKEMAAFIDAQEQIPCRFLYKGTVKTADEIETLVKEANYSDACCGIVTWMHTFSPSKMWINGFALLQKPYCHGFHESQSGGAWRPRAWIYRHADAPAAQGRCGILAGCARSGRARRLDAQRDRLL